MTEKLRRSPLYPVLAKLYPLLHKTLIWWAWQICSLFPVQRQKIVFSNFNGSGFGDNTRYIAEECIRRRIPHRLYWVCEKPGCTFPPELIIIRPNTLRFVYHMSTAGIWVDNTRKLYYFKKKKSQTYVQTWHGGPGLKRIERDAGSGLSREYIAYAKKDSEHIDLLLSCCGFCTRCYRNCFWYDGPILEKGIPKNDLYFRDIPSMRRMVRAYYELPEEVNADADKLALLETVRGLAAVMIGLIEDYTRSAWETPGIPKMTFVAEAADYVTAEGVSISKENVDLLSRMMSMQKAHPSYAMTGAMCTAAAAVVPGSVVNQVLSENVDTQFIRIGHPSGVLECGVDYEENGAEPVVADTFGFRTANLLMDGTAHIK